MLLSTSSTRVVSSAVLRLMLESYLVILLLIDYSFKLYYISRTPDRIKRIVLPKILGEPLLSSCRLWVTVFMVYVRR